MLTQSSYRNYWLVLRRWWRRLWAPNEDVPPAARLKWRAGTVIVCPDCREPVMRVREDIYSGDLRRLATFADLGGMDYSRPNLCRRCGSGVMRENGGETQAHTTAGWVG